MRPYLGPTVRIKKTVICVAGDFTYNPEQIDEMESIAYLWSDHKINIQNNLRRIRAEDIQPILNSTTILRCRIWEMENTHFPFKEYEILYAMKILEVRYHGDDSFDLWHRYWQQFLEKPGVKPIVAFYHLHRKNVDNLLDQLSKDFSSAVSQNTYTIIIESVRNDLLNEF
ncbi:hypothetical protein DdX_18749 [Ditylenchus destructor]|uniref:Uncharacterized protein n=1 Tax=Ditylenchus destructor TaxID=166010 RepID=A0AAD4QXT7_9BILA|nr:hypothetical protein DdX_18749 [Ditylenchus destructor]